MGHVTRLEISQLMDKFEEKVVPKDQGLCMRAALMGGVNLIRHDLDGTSGAPSVRLRNQARVLKHYIEAPKDPRNIYYANYVISQVNRGVDPTKAIKRARLECDPAQAEENIRKSLKQAQKAGSLDGAPDRNPDVTIGRSSVGHGQEHNRTPHWNHRPMTAVA